LHEKEKLKKRKEKEYSKKEILYKGAKPPENK